MSPTYRLRVAIGGLVLLIAVGTAGYVFLEGMSFLDALFMTVTTISTVGYREVQPLDTSGRIFTIALIVFGVGTALYLLTATAQVVIEGQLGDFWGRARMQRRIDALEGHVILVGFGRFGRVVGEELHRQRVPTVIIDHDLALEKEFTDSGALHVIGSGLSDDVLERAGIRRARALVVATASDADNVFVTLSAREKNPSLRIHARGESDEGLRRLRLAGANQVISAYQMGAQRVAACILRPSVVDFLEISAAGRGETIDLEEVRVEVDSTLVGTAIAEVERANPRLRVVARKHGSESIELIPEPASQISAGDLLVVIGDREGLERLARQCSARTA